MKALVIGGSGFVGSVVAEKLHATPGISVTIASRRANPCKPYESLELDATDMDAVSTALKKFNVVVNCVTGSGDTIRDSTTAIANAISQSSRPIGLVHMSSMAVYGGVEGDINEDSTLGGGGNWYAQAKADAENTLLQMGKCPVSILRIGCVYGPGSLLWVTRIGTLLRSRRLGNIAELGDGWSNLVDVSDIANAVLACIAATSDGVTIYNVAAPDSPRWNDYFDDFAMAAGYTPICYKTRRSMMVESRLIAPPLKIMERLGGKIRLPFPVAQSIPPSLLRLWSQQIRLDSTKISQSTGLEWTPYEAALDESVAYFLKTDGAK